MRKTLRILAIIYIVYLALSLLVISPALNLAPHWYLQDNYGRKLETKWVLFNPLTLSLEAREASLANPDDTPFVALDSLSVNLSTASLWRQGWVLDKLELTGLFAHVTQLAEGQFNFDDFLPAEDAPQEPETEDGAVPGVTVRDLHLHASALIYTDNARAKPLTSRWNDMDIAIQELSTVQADGRPYTLEVYGPQGGKLHWQGEVSIPNASSEGTLSLTELDLHTLWQVAEPWLEFEVGTGKFSMEGRYAINWQDALDYTIQEGEISMHTLSIKPGPAHDLEDTGLELVALNIQPVALDGTRQAVTVGDIAIDGLALSGWMSEQRLSLQEMFLGAPDPNEPAAVPSTAPVAARVNETAVADPNDPAVVAPDEPAVADMNVPAVADPNEPPVANPTRPQVAANTPAQTGSASAGGSTDEQGWTVSLGQLTLSNSAVTWRSPYTDPDTLSIQPIEAKLGPVQWPLAEDTAFELSLIVNEATRISTDGSLALAEGKGVINYALSGLPLAWVNPNLPEALKAKIMDGALGIEGDVSLAEFAPQQIGLSGAITDFSVQIDTSDVPISGWQTVRVDELSVDMLEHHLVLGKLSIDDYSGRIHIAKDGSINASNIWQEELGAQADEIAEELTEDKPWTFAIPQIVVTDSKVDFMDQSLPIPFRAVIGDLNGEVKGLGASEPAAVDFEGSVDGYAPVLLKGSLDPFLATPFLDLELSFDGVDMALLSPYSSTYAGYKIDQGLLNLDLQYKLKDNQLAGNNKLRLDQLKLGEKVASDKAVDAPLELALAIMTDANGLIDIQVPVSGNVDDPSFSIGGLVGKAFLNILTKAVTAPFSLLAGLVNSEEDLQRLTFDSGSAELEQANRDKLAQLHGALEQRPGLNLTITGRLKPAADTERLQKTTLKQQLAEAGLAQEEIDSKGPGWDKAIAKRYRKLDLPAPAEGEVSSREQYLALARQISIADEQLLQLAEQRAVAVKTYLVNEAGMDPGRAVVAQPDLEPDDNQFSGVELGID